MTRLANVDIEETRIKEAYERRALLSNAVRYTYFDRANLSLIQEREGLVLALLQRLGREKLDRMRMLEVGCGGGFWLRQFIQWGCLPEKVCGVDLLPDRIEAARRGLPAAVHLTCGSATRLNFPDETFDLMLQSTVFSSILDRSLCRQIAIEMLRVLKPNGLLLWYDLRVGNPANLDVRPIRKAEILSLFPSCRIRLQRITLAPPIARRIAPLVPSLYPLLSGLKLFCTHYLAAIEKI